MAFVTANGRSAIPGGGSGSLQTLAKIDGHREVRHATEHLRRARGGYNAQTAQQMWNENIPAGPAEKSGDPREPGRYGDIAEVDFDQQAVALWSSGRSGSCPGWVSDVALDSGYVVVTEVEDSGLGGACSSDYNPYRVLVIVDRATCRNPRQWRRRS